MRDGSTQKHDITAVDCTCSDKVGHFHYVAAAGNTTAFIQDKGVAGAEEEDAPNNVPHGTVYQSHTVSLRGEGTMS